MYHCEVVPLLAHRQQVLHVLIHVKLALPNESFYRAKAYTELLIAENHLNTSSLNLYNKMISQ